MLVFNSLQFLTIPVPQVAFFTNQMGIAKGKLRPEVFKSKVEDILTTLQLAVQVDTIEA